jgi:hypothetical protein
MTVYDKEGIEHEKAGVDARECVANLGWTLEKPKPKKLARK